MELKRMTETTEEMALQDYDGKMVVVHITEDDGELTEMVGKVEAASDAGIAFKEKGKRAVILLERKDIYEIAVAPEDAELSVKRLVQKRQKPITEKNAKAHLFHYHNFERADADAYSPEGAFTLHESIDHKNLGHKHVAESKGGTEDENSDSDD
jgi:hypothetical protein